MRGPYANGALVAFQKFAVSGETLKHIAELGGLGLLTVPVLHHLLHSETGTDQAMAGTELAGLGLLAAPTVHHLLKA